MSTNLVKPLIIASTAATIGLLISQKTSTTQALTTVFMSAWLVYQFSGAEKAWKSLGNFTNPVLFAINTFFASYIYLSWNAIPSGKAFNISTGLFLLGGATSLLIFKYWTIGD